MPMKKFLSLCIYFFIIFPFFWGLRTSLADRYDMGLVPSRLTLEHYHVLISRPEFLVYLQNSLIVSFSSIIVTVFISVLGGYSLARLQFRGRRFGFLLLILPLLPPVAILVPLVSYFQKLGLYNTLIAVIVANVVFNIPLSVWMIRNFILGNLYAFALTSSQSLRVLPQGILSFLGSWGTYWGGLTAAGILVLIPPVILFLFFQKWFIAGIFGQQLK
jgi:multiple sugar transport system permease protein